MKFTAVVVHRLQRQGEELEAIIWNHEGEYDVVADNEVVGKMTNMRYHESDSIAIVADIELNKPLRPLYPALRMNVTTTCVEVAIQSVMRQTGFTSSKVVSGLVLSEIENIVLSVQPLSVTVDGVRVDMVVSSMTGDKSECIVDGVKYRRVEEE